MSLFGFKKTSERKILCSYCLQEFPANNVHFRSTNPNLPKEQDPILDKYKRTYFGKDIRSELMPPAIIPDLANPAGVTYWQNPHDKKDRMPIAMPDSLGLPTRKRICPLCHNELPRMAGLYSNDIISIVGGSGVGKTVYLATLYQYIRTFCNELGLLIEPQNQHTQEHIDKLVSQLFGWEQGRGHQAGADAAAGIGATAVAYQPPLCFRLVRVKDGVPLQEEQHNKLLYIFDFPGEVLSLGEARENYLNLQARHMQIAKALIILLDPLRMEKLMALLSPAEKQALHLDAKNIPPDQVLQDIINAGWCAGDGSEMGKIKRQTAIAFTKSDYLSAVLKTMAERKAVSSLSADNDLFQPRQPQAVFDENRSLRHHDQLREFIAEQDSRLNGIMHSGFANHRLFSLSATGAMMERGKLMYSPSPVNIADPLLWILTTMGLLA